MSPWLSTPLQRLWHLVVAIFVWLMMKRAEKFLKGNSEFLVGQIPVSSKNPPGGNSSLLATRLMVSSTRSTPHHQGQFLWADSAQPEETSLSQEQLDETVHLTFSPRPWSRCSCKEEGILASSWRTRSTPCGHTWWWWGQLVVQASCGKILLN